MTDGDVKALVEKARLWDFDGVAFDPGAAANLIVKLADALEAATVAPAVDREALIERIDGSALDHFLKSFNGDEAGDIDYVWAEDGNTGWVMRGGNDVASVLLKAFDALLASGLLRDVRDVQAEALERAREEIRSLACWADPVTGRSGFNLGNDEDGEAGARMAVLDILAQAIREARSER